METPKSDFTYDEHDLNVDTRAIALAFVRSESIAMSGKTVALNCSPMLPSPVAVFKDGVCIFTATSEQESQWHKQSKRLLALERGL